MADTNNINPLSPNTDIIHTEHVIKRNNQKEQQQQQQLLKPGPSNGSAVCGNNVENSVTNKKPILIEHCSDPESCVSLINILKSFNAPISEDQAWALIYQSVQLYRDVCRQSNTKLRELRVPGATRNLNVHKDGSVHISFNKDGMYLHYIYR